MFKHRPSRSVVVFGFSLILAIIGLMIAAAAAGAAPRFGFIDSVRELFGYETVQTVVLNQQGTEPQVEPTPKLLAPNAATVSWVSAAGSTAWYTAANWSPSTASGAWLTSDTAQFNNTGTAVTAGINMGTAALSIGAVEMTSTRTRALTIGNSSATTGTLTLNGTSVNSVANTILRNASNSDLTLQNNETGSGKTMNIALANATENVINLDGSGNITISSIISGSGKNLTLGGAGSGALILSGPNTYSGVTRVTSGSLFPTNAGSLSNSSIIEIAGGGKLDVTGLGTGLTLASGQTLKASGTATTGNLNVNSANGITTASNSPLQFTAFDGTHAPLTLTGGTGTVTLASGNPVTVNTTSALGAGDYTLIAKGASGAVAGSVPTSLTIGGSGLAANSVGTLQITGAQLILHVVTLPTVNLSVNTNSATEAAATVVTVTATASSAVSGAQTVNLGVTGTGITAGDYSLSSSTITIPNGGTTGTATFTVVNDALAEGTETARITESSPSSGIALGATTFQDITITDNDNAPVASSSTPSVASGNTVTVTFSATDANNDALTFTITGHQGFGFLNPNGPGTPVCSAGTCTTTAQYTPNNGFTGVDHIRYTASDGTNTSAEANIDITVNAATCTPAPGGMVAWYPGDGNTDDIQGPTFSNGALFNGATYTAGKVGQAFNLTGTAYVEAPGSGDLDITGGQVTLGGWINPSAALTTEQWFFGKEQSGYIPYALEWEPGGIAARANGGFTQFAYTPPANTWTHIAMVYDGAASPTTKIYVNGALLTSSSAASGNLTSSTAPFTIGDLGGTYGRNFVGKIDEVEVFSSALSQAQVLAIYDASTAGICRSCTAPPSGMIGWYPGENNANDIGGANNGTFTLPTYAAGKVGQAFSFDGVAASYVTATAPGTLTTLTMDAWINPAAYVDTDSQPSVIFERRVDNVDKIGLQLINNNGTLTVYIGGSQYATTTSGVVPLNQWSHVAVTITPNGGQRDISIYVNGTVVGSTTTSSFSTNPGTLSIARAVGFINRFNGQIDEVEVFNRGLSASEVASIADAGNAGKCHTSKFYFSSATATVGEGAGTAAITVVRDGANDSAATVDRATASGSATGGASCGAGVDFVSLSAGALSFASGDSSKTFNVTICDDAVFESSEDFTASLSNATGSTSIIAPSTETVTITENDPPPPAITTSVTSLTDFGSVTVGNASLAQSYTVSGANLTADITITAPANFEVSKTSATSGFAGSQTLTQSGGTVSTTTIYVRFTPGSTGALGGDVANATTGATTRNVAVTGTGAPAVCTAPPTGMVGWWTGDGNAQDVQGPTFENGTASGSRYVLTSSAKSWTAAEAEAVSLGGHLVAINSAAENTYLINTFATGANAARPLWTGFTDQSSEGTFVWSNGDPVTYTNWNASEPNNLGGAENYGTLNWYFASSGGAKDTWNDTPLNGSTGFGGTSDGPYFGIIELPPYVPGKVGQAFSFNTSGTTGVSVPSSAALPTSGSIGVTLDAWVNPSSLPNAFPVIMRRDRTTGGGVQYAMSLDQATGGLECGIGSLGTQVVAGSVPLNTWSHVACTYDLTTIRGYINGIEVGNAANSTGIFASSLPLGIGFQDRPSNPHIRDFDGLIDEAEVFDHALTATEIANIYNASTAGKCEPEIAVEQPSGTDLTDGVSSIDFGSSNVGVAATAKSFSIRNTGPATLNVGAITVDGANSGDFVVDVSGMSPTVSTGGNTAFTVTFTPSAGGARTAALHIANNDSTENPFDIALTGTGVTPDGAISGGNLIFTESAGTRNDTPTFSCSSGFVVIHDPNNTLIAGAGGTQVDANTIKFPLGSITGNIQINTLLGNDTLTLDLSGGCDFIPGAALAGESPLTPVGGLTFNGGVGGNDKLIISGGNQGNVTYNYTNAHDGSVVMQNFGTVNYTGLEPVINSGTAADVIFNLPSGGNAATLADLGGGQTRLGSGGTFEQTDFTNPTGSVTVNPGSTSDTMAVSALAASYPSLTLGSAGGGEFSTIDFNGAITFASGKSLAGFALSTISLPNTTSDLATSGTGAISLTTARNITMSSGSSIGTVNGNITLNANQQSPATSGNFVGFNSASAVVASSGTGTVTINARGGNTGASNFGVYLSGTSVVQGGTTVGSITTDINATGGGGGTNPHGIDVDGGSVTSLGGDVTVRGFGGTGSTGDVYGVIPINGGQITSGGNGNVIVQGTGGSSSSNNYGVIPHQAGGLITSGGTGSVTVTGTGGNGSGSMGVYVFRDGRITSGGLGAVSVTGNGGGTSGGGVRMFTDVGPARINSGGGPITVTGTKTGGGIGIHLVTNAAQIQSSANAPVTLISDNITLDGGTTSVVSAGTGNVTLRQLTNGFGINLGGADSGTELGLTDNELDKVTAATLNIGDANSGRITFSGQIDLTDTPLVPNLNLVTGADIFDNFAGTELKVANLAMTAQTGIGVGGNVLDIDTDSITATTTNSNIEIGEANSTNIAAGDLNSGNGTIILRGSGGNGIYVTAPGSDLNGNTQVIGTLKGTGTVNGTLSSTTISGNSGTIAPGASAGILNSNGNASFNSASTFAVEVGGTTVGTQYDQLNVTGTVSLGNATLSLSQLNSFVPSVGDSFKIINNDGTGDPVSGTFNGLAEGALIPNFLGGTLAAKISYVGGDGNDVVLTIPPAGSLQFSSATYSQSEAGATATITVTRTGGTNGAVSASYATVAGGTATGGASCGGAVDYQNTSGTVSFGDTITTQQTFTISICPDAVYEPGETVNLALTSPTGGATLGSPNTAVLTITNDDPVPVNSTADTNDGSCDLLGVGTGNQDCTLREAIAATPAGGTVTFSSLFNSAQTITIAGAGNPFTISKNLTITGPGANLLTISGNNASLVFDVGGFTVGLSGLTVTGGNSFVGLNETAGGGIVNGVGGNLTITNCTVTGNNSGSTASYAGGIFNFNNLTIIGSTISNNGEHNPAFNTAGGISSQGGSLTIVNSTISGNTVDVAGGDSAGGILVFTGSSNVVNSTIAGNSVNTTNTSAGGIRLSDVTFIGTMDIRNSIVAGNTNNSTYPDVSGPFTSKGNNLIGNADGATGFGQPGDQAGTGASPLNAFLGPLQDNGGPTFTHALQAGSPAIDTGNNCVLTTCSPAYGFSITTDQRGVTRPLNSTVDIGAFESPNVAPSVVSITRANANPTNASSVDFTVTFSESVSGGTTANFAKTTTGTVVGTISSVTGSGTARTVTVSSITGDGTLRLDLANSTGITDSDGATLSPATFTTGEVYTIDRTAPDTTITANPTNPSASTSASFSFTGNDGSGTGVAGFECQLDGGGYSACTSSQNYSSLGQGSHSFQVRAVDAAGNVDATPASYTWLVDTVAPDTSITANPTNPTNSTSASFSFTGSDPGGSGVASFQCSLDFAAFTACTTPQSYSSLFDGTHNFQVRAIDNAGNVDASPASFTWLVDTIAPDTSILTNPTNPTASTSATFTFSGTDGGAPPVAERGGTASGPQVGIGGSGVASFECKLDAGAFAACTSPKTYTGLADGSHTFQVRAIDNAGNVDPTPASFTWVVDATAPDTTITANPTNPSNSTSASFSFTGSDPGGSGVASFQCQLDGGGFSACTSAQSYSSLGQGSHTFQVRAIDNAGNVDATPASFTWVVDTVSPDTSIVTSPPLNSNSTSATFTFSGSDPGGSGVASLQCQLDGGGFTTCTSPKNYTGLFEGSHTFQVRAIDNAGNVDATPASYTWTVDTIAPDTSILTNPTNPTNSTSAIFTFTGSDGGAPPVAEEAAAPNGFSGGSGVAGFECKLDAGAFAACTSPKNYTGLADGSHTFQVRTVDNAGNVDGSPASFTWVVDATAPDTTILTNPAANSNSTSAAFTFSGTDGSGTGIASFECKLDAGAFAACTSPQNYAALGQGSHTFQVRATDNVGNVDATPASYTWTVDTIAPTVTINQAAGQADPTSASPIQFTVVFSEAVTGFTSNSGDVVLSGGSGANAYTVTGGPSTYTVSVTGMNANGNVIATVPLGAAADLAGNTSSASTSTDNTVTFVATIPTTTVINSDLPDPSGVGQTVTVNYTVATAVPPPPTGPGQPEVAVVIPGNVTVTDSLSAATCTATAAAGTCNIVLPNAGARTLTATFGGSGNYLTSSGTAAHLVDGPPAAAATAANVTTPGASSYTFTVTYTDDISLNVATLDSNDVRVTGPNSFNAAASFVSVNNNTNGTPRTATYSIVPPGGTWDGIDNGAYSVVMQGSQVADTFGNFVPAGSIGGFTVTVPTVSISGNIKQFVAGGPNTNLSGVTVTLTGGSAAAAEEGAAAEAAAPEAPEAVTTTDTNGNYTFTTLTSGQSFVITPSMSGKVFEPITRTYNNLTVNVTNADFVAYNDPAGIPRNLRLANSFAVPGQPVTVPVVLTSLGNEAFVSFSVTYNNNVIAGNPTAACGSAAPGCTVTFNNATPGTIGVTVIPAVPFTAGQREVALITFQTLPNNASSTPVTFGNAPTAKLFKNANGDPLPSTYTDGLIVFQQGLEGDISNRNTGNGDVDATDIPLLSQMVVGTLTPNPAFNEFQRADVSPSNSKGDGQLDATDVVVERNYIARNLATQTAGGPSGPNTVPAAPARDTGNARTVSRKVRAVSGKAANGRVTVAVEMDIQGDEAAASFTLNYDATRLANPTVTLGKGMSSSARLASNTAEAGFIGILVDGVDSTFTGRQLVNLTFDIVQGAAGGETTVSFSSTLAAAAVSNAGGEALDTSYEDGTVTIPGAASNGVTISGRVTTPDGRGLRNATVTIAAADGTRRTVTTGAFGTYSFDAVAAGARYSLTVNSRQFRFTARNIDVSESLSDVDFAAHE